MPLCICTEAQRKAADLAALKAAAAANVAAAEAERQTAMAALDAERKAAEQQASSIRMFLFPWERGWFKPVGDPEHVPMKWYHKLYASAPPA